MSTWAQQDEERVARVCSQLGPRNRMEGPSSSLVGKRPRLNSPPRLAATLAPSARLVQTCSYCKRAGHSEPYCFTRMRDFGFTPPQRNFRPPQQTLQISPLRAMRPNQSTASLISHATVKHLGLRPSPFVGVKIIAAAGTFSEATKICYDCPIDLGCKLTVMKAEIGCDTKTVKIHKDDCTSLTFSVQVSYERRILCYASLEDGYTGPSITDTPVVQDFWDVFKNIPGLPPRREIDFTIDLVPGAKPISLPTYRMPPCEMEELWTQIDNLLESGFIRPSVSPWGARSYL
ncbi:uncharacterized protein LOC131256270 [Magnolia sinica]|uniref:uncharacterized protein LOC131256270 n=1 Tax=Magnolia sinica TaxID=86752 RepID=UPI00265A86AA|nr:uncharacterized protein LOC131256270 [Magnolia sinica]